MGIAFLAGLIIGAMIAVIWITVGGGE
jgi:hypothetical protein